MDVRDTSRIYSITSKTPFSSMISWNHKIEAKNLLKVHCYSSFTIQQFITFAFLFNFAASFAAARPRDVDE